MTVLLAVTVPPGLIRNPGGSAPVIFQELTYCPLGTLTEARTETSPPTLVRIGFEVMENVMLFPAEAPAKECTAPSEATAPAQARSNATIRVGATGSPQLEATRSKGARCKRTISQPRASVRRE